MDGNNICLIMKHLLNTNCVAISGYSPTQKIQYILYDGTPEKIYWRSVIQILYNSDKDIIPEANTNKCYLKNSIYWYKLHEMYDTTINQYIYNINITIHINYPWTSYWGFLAWTLIQVKWKPYQPNYIKQGYRN